MSGSSHNNDGDGGSAITDYFEVFEQVAEAVVDTLSVIVTEETRSPELRDVVQQVLTQILINFITNTTDNEFTAHFRSKMAIDHIKAEIAKAIGADELGMWED